MNPLHLMVLAALMTASCPLQAASPAAPAAPIDFDVCYLARAKSSARYRPRLIVGFLRQYNKKSAPPFRSVRAAASLGEHGCDIFLIGNTPKSQTDITAQVQCAYSKAKLMQLKTPNSSGEKFAFERFWSQMIEVFQQGQPLYEQVSAQRKKTRTRQPAQQERKRKDPLNLPAEQIQEIDRVL